MQNPLCRIDALDALRGWAAAGIVVIHACSLNLLTVPAPLEDVLPLLTLGVQLFFTLSAFCLCVGYFGRIDNSAGVRRFFWNRFWRIAPLLYFMLALWVPVLAWKFTAPSLAEIAVNLTFLFNLIPSKATGIVWASWSIGVEMLLYLLFPLCLLICTSMGRSLAFLAVVTAAAVAFRSAVLTDPGIPDDYAWYSVIAALPCFAAGIATFHAWRGIPRPWYRTASRAFLAVALSIFALVWVGDLNLSEMQMSPAGAFLLPAAFPFLILSQILTPARFIVNRFTTYWGVRGYSVYLLHPLIILLTIPFVQTWIYADGKQRSGEWLPFMATMCAMLLLTGIFAALAYRYIEVPGRDLRNAEFWGRREPSAPERA